MFMCNFNLQLTVTEWDYVSSVECNNECIERKHNNKEALIHSAASAGRWLLILIIIINIIMILDIILVLAAHAHGARLVASLGDGT